MLGRTPSGGETEEAASASSRLLQRERSRASQRYRRRIITAIVATLGLLAFSRLVFGTAWMAPFPLHNHLTVLGASFFIVPRCPLFYFYNGRMHSLAMPMIGETLFIS
ncbi:unnamed protein product [Dibothriocephalus latus]|uniref:Uncharacterized protein n=1 Tax=Dibothriocephalus latus TaxID=60516 RepID=A0A3P6SFZ9_DIBLA|nr:unnamed protein product [Dibothriocephalus latus]